MLICNVVGARPNFMKMAPIINELRRRGFNQRLVHTGKHYDERMSKIFFDELNLPRPDIYRPVAPKVLKLHHYGKKRVDPKYTT